MPQSAYIRLPGCEAVEVKPPRSDIAFAVVRVVGGKPHVLGWHVLKNRATEHRRRLEATNPRRSYAVLWVFRPFPDVKRSAER